MIQSDSYRLVRQNYSAINYDSDKYSEQITDVRKPQNLQDEQQNQSTQGIR